MSRKKVKMVAVLKTGEAPKEGQTDKEMPLRVTEYKTLPEKIAKSTICVKNWYVPELREKYNNYDRMKRIDIMFPYANLKAAGDMRERLLVDLPRNEQETEMCILKAKQLKKLGYRYCYLEDDSTLFDALAQLGET